MLTIIHGDDTAASRTFFVNQKHRAQNPIAIDADTLTLTDIAQLQSGGGLFGEQKYLFVESLITKKKKSLELAQMLTAFVNDPDLKVYLWEGKEVDKKTLTTYPTAVIHIFTLPKSLFLFLDALKPRSPQLLPLYHQTIATVEIELVSFMIVRQMRLMLGVSARSGLPIDEVKRMSPWQKTKLEKQAKYFRIDILKSHYRKLYELDLAQKTGTLPVPLDRAIDFWLLEL